LESREYLVGGRFSAADIITGGTIYYLTMFKVMNETPVLKAYTDRITARPAFKRAMEL
jgi:glutathione S-transferase